MVSNGLLWNTLHRCSYGPSAFHKSYLIQVTLLGVYVNLGKLAAAKKIPGNLDAMKRPRDERAETPSATTEETARHQDATAGLHTLQGR